MSLRGEEVVVEWMWRRRRSRKAVGREGGGSYCGGWGGGAGGRKVWWFGLEVAEGGNDGVVEVDCNIPKGNE